MGCDASRLHKRPDTVALPLQGRWPSFSEDFKRDWRPWATATNSPYFAHNLTHPGPPSVTPSNHFPSKLVDNLISDVIASDQRERSNPASWIPHEIATSPFDGLRAPRNDNK